MSLSSSNFARCTHLETPVAAVGLILGTLFLAVPIEGQSPAIAPACYDLDLGPWEPHMELDADSIYVAPPPRILLDTIPRVGLGRPTGYWLGAAPGALPSIHRFSSWTRMESDSIELVWTNGFSGFRAKLSTRSTPLVGIAQTFWDFGRPQQTASLTAAAVSCDAPLPEASAFRYRFPRGIGMAGSDSILIGETLDRSRLQLEEESDRTVLVHSSPNEPFQNAVDLRIVLGDDNRVRQIRFSLPETISHEQAVATMRLLYGDPTSQRQTELRSGRISYVASWSDRLISIVVSGGAEGPQFVMVRDPRAR